MHFEKVSFEEFKEAFTDMWMHQNLDKALEKFNIKNLKKGGVL